MWTLPYGKPHIDDTSIEISALREAAEKVHLTDVDIKHAGDCYIRVYLDKKLITSTLAHIFKCKTDNVEQNDNQISS